MKPRDLPLSASEHAALIAWLRAHGMTLGQANAVLGGHNPNQSRQQLATVLTTWLKSRPRG